MNGRSWYSQGELAVLGMGSALPGAPVSNAELIGKVRAFDPALSARSAERLGARLGIGTRHLSRNFASAIEGPMPRILPSASLSSEPMVVAASICARQLA